MKTIRYIAGTLLAAVLLTGACACTNLDEKTFDLIDSSAYYKDKNSLDGAVASIYSSAQSGFLEYFWYLNEFPADQVAWRTWNGGAWGYDEAEKFVLSTQTWNAESKIIRSAWEHAWETIGLCNTMLGDLEKLDPKALGVTDDELKQYIAELRTMRAWAYYKTSSSGAAPFRCVRIPTATSPDRPTRISTQDAR